MSVPLNGRVAIVDDKVEEALPLMKVLSKNQIPFVFYKADEMELLPEEGKQFNDIRVLFLDLNLRGNTRMNVKDVVSSQRGVLRRVLSPTNYPYLIILWSKQENDYADAVETLFTTALKDRAPIGVHRFVKADYFDQEGNLVGDINNLFPSVLEKLNETPTFSYLLDWENKVHVSADATLQGLFEVPASDWTVNANYLLNKLGSSYSGKHFRGQSASDKLKSSMNALNVVFTDTLESKVNHVAIGNAIELNGTNSTSEALSSINTKLLISNEIEPANYPGMVMECGKRHEQQFKELSNELLNVSQLKTKALNVPNIDNLDEVARKKLIDKALASARAEIRKTWRQVFVNATPLCDFVQKKVCHDRLILGALVTVDAIHLVDDKSESIFVSPKFDWDGGVVHLVLHFRFLFTLDTKHVEPDTTPIFRVRQQLLAEIQSKLARHVSRQGVLFLD